ncbi:MAG: translation initiation factor 2 [Ruminococcus flavefaciens]|nr:translation initiation factor 2 [Ruminococcus flavefaciens]
MKGIHQVSVSNNRIKFKFEIKRNISIVQGNSATGKTTLYELIKEHMQFGDNSGVNLSCDKKCVVLDDIEWKVRLRKIKDSIVFIDEGVSFISTKEFAREIKKTDNYYVIFNRENLKELPYSVEEIYEIKKSGRYYSFVKSCKSEPQHFLYGITEKFTPDCILTEDSKSGNQFFKAVAKKIDIDCFSAKGNSNVYKWLDENRGKKILVIADGAAFGPYIKDILKLQAVRSDEIRLCLPESFEWVVLASNLLKDNEIITILNNPADYIESKEYFSWEKFFEELLINKTSNNAVMEHKNMIYHKKKLNSYYLSDRNIKEILSVLNGLLDE